MSFWVRAPDHLGDGVMALPAVAALAGLGAVGVAGPGWVEALYGHTGAVRAGPKAMPGDTAVLFKPSFSAAWAARAADRRYGAPGDGRGLLLSDVVRAEATHRMDQYNQIAKAVGAVAEGPPSLPPVESAEYASEVSDVSILLLPCSPSGLTVRWPHFRALADALDGRAVFAAGPGEDEDLAGIAGPHPRLPALSIPAFAAVSARAAAVVGNDSGLSHLAAAARRGAERPATDVHVIYASTDPARTGPPGTTAHTGSRPLCWPCYRKTCSYSLGCMDVPVAAVLAELATPP